MKRLLPFQRELLIEISAAFCGGFRSVCLQLETGGGKTVVAGQATLDLFRSLGSRRGAVTLHLVHRKELLEQTYRTLCDFGLEKYIGIIGSGYPETPWAPLQIGSVPSVLRRLNRLKTWLRPKLKIWDETHHILADSWADVAAAFPRGYDLGLTATPARTDGRGLGSHYGHMVVGPPYPELVKIGILCPVRTYSVPIDIDLSALRKGQRGDFTRSSLEKAIPRGPVIASAIKNFEALARDRRTLFFGHTVEASKDFCAKLRSIGYRAEHVDGTTSAFVRGKIFQRFGSGETQVLGNYDVATEGYDCPECDCVILGRKTASLIFYRQAVGRAKRAKKDGRGGLIIDLCGNLDDHGDPDEEIEWTLEDGAISESVERAKSKGRTCANCGFRYKRSLEACPMCGEKPAVKHIEYADVGVEQRKSVKTRKGGGKTKRAIIFAKAAQSTGDKQVLLKLAAEGGYNPKVIYIWKQLYGGKWAANQAREAARRSMAL